MTPTPLSQKWCWYLPSPHSKTLKVKGWLDGSSRLVGGSSACNFPSHSYPSFLPKFGGSHLFLPSSNRWPICFSDSLFPRDLKFSGWNLGSTSGLHRSNDRKTHCPGVIEYVNLKEFGMFSHLRKRITVRKGYLHGAQASPPTLLTAFRGKHTRSVERSGHQYLLFIYL